MDRLAAARTALLLATAGATVLLLVAVASASPASEPDWRLFAANGSLLGSRVACSESEKACMRYNRVLHRASGRCYPLGAWEPCKETPGTFLTLERSALEGAKPALRAVCSSSPPCPEGGYRMAYDGACYARKDVQDICRAPLAPRLHFFGDYECACRGKTCPEEPYVEQPMEEGECKFPNLRDDISQNFLPSLPSASMPCSEEQSACFSQRKLFFEGQCYEPQEKGPCPEGSSLALDGQDAKEGRVTVICLSDELCSPGSKFMAYHEQCVAVSEIESVLCAGWRIFTDIFGETVCSPKDSYYSADLYAPEPGHCAIRYMIAMH